MRQLRNRFGMSWSSLGPRFLPFADVATPDLSLGRLVRLSLFQVSVGMTLVLLVGTLNRVMIVELDVPAALVGVMIALPLVFAPFRALIGFSSDTHRCELGWRRVPFIWRGTLLQFGGFAIMPFALLVLAGKGQAATAPMWIGHSAAALAFLLVGAGSHTVQTAGLALATDLTPPESHSKVVGLMYVMLLLGMIASALVFGAGLADFSPGRLVQVIQGAALAALVLNSVAMWKQETRRPPRGAPAPAPDPTFRESWNRFTRGEQAVRRLVVVGLGTMAFGMSDVLLEPFGGQILHLSVAATTRLTALLALGGLLGFGFASHVIGRGADPYRVSHHGALLGLPAFALVIVAAPLGLTALFLAGNFLIGFGGALFGHGTLTATMNRAPARQAGLALGAWGAVQATAAGVAMALGGTIRDLVDVALGATGTVWGFAGAASGYVTVYALEIGLLLVTLAATFPLIRRRAVRRSRAPDPVGALRFEEEPTTAGTAGGSAQEVPMARREILEVPDARLRRTARPVTVFDRDLARLAEDLIDTLHATAGIGLSAPQLGDPRRVLVMDLSGDASAPQLYVNPEILAASTYGLVEESCLSVPGVVANVVRATELRVRARDGQGQAFERDLSGMEAVCLQHEMDHLEGKLFVDRLSLPRRWLARAAAARRVSGRRVSGRRVAREPALTTP